MLTQSRNFWRQYVRSLFSRASTSRLRTVKRQRQISRVAAAEVLEGRALLATITASAGSTLITNQNSPLIVDTSVTVGTGAQNDVWKPTGTGAGTGILNLSITAGLQTGDAISLPNGTLYTVSGTQLLWNGNGVAGVPVGSAVN